MFTVNRKQLAEELSLLQSVAERKGTIPALSTILFNFSDGVLTLTGSDMDTTLSTRLDAAGEEWSGCIPSKQLYDLVRLFKEDEISFKAAPNERIGIQCGKSKHSLPIMSADSFPSADRVEGSVITIDGDALSVAIARALKATSPDVKDLWMQGVSLHSRDGSLFVAATNSRNFAVTELPSEIKIDVIIPIKAAQALVKFLTGEIEIRSDKNQATFREGERLFTSRLISAKFVDWRPLVPTSYDHVVTLSAEPTRQAFKLASVTAQESALIPVPLRLTITKTEALIETVETTKGQSSERLEINCETLNGDTLTKGVNGLHFINFLDSDLPVIMSFNKEMNLIQLSPENEPNYKYITMALR